MRRKYREPSVQEAIFEAKFDLVGFDSAVPGQIYEKVKDRFPVKKDIKTRFFHLGSADASVLPLPPSEMFQRPVMQAVNEDGSALIQIGPGLAVANRIKYTNWEDFTLAIKAVLDAYIEFANPNTINRIGVRYINNFLIKETSINISDYFNFGIKVPDVINSLDGFDWSFLSRCCNDGQEFKIATRLYTDSLSITEKGSKFLLDIDCVVIYDNLNGGANLV